MKTRVNKKTTTSASGTTLTPALNEELIYFMRFHRARRLSTNLRTLLLEFLMYDGGTEAVYLKDLVQDLEGMFRLLDAIEAAQINLHE